MSTIITPTRTAHANTHAAGQSDPITPAAIGALSNANGITAIVKMTQAEYDALATKSASTLYVISG